MALADYDLRIEYSQLISKIVGFSDLMRKKLEKGEVVTANVTLYLERT